MAARPDSAGHASCTQLRHLLQLGLDDGTPYAGLKMLSDALPPARHVALRAMAVDRRRGSLRALRALTAADPGLEVVLRYLHTDGCETGLTGLKGIADICTEDPAALLPPSPSEASAQVAAERGNEERSRPAVSPSPPPAEQPVPAAEQQSKPPRADSRGSLRRHGSSSSHRSGRRSEPEVDLPPAQPRVRRHSSASGLPSAYLTLMDKHAGAGADGAAARLAVGQALRGRQHPAEARSAVLRKPLPPANRLRRRDPKAVRPEPSRQPEQASAAPEHHKKAAPRVNAVEAITTKQGQLQDEIASIQKRRQMREQQRAGGRRARTLGRTESGMLPPLPQSKRQKPAMVQSSQQGEGLPQLKEGTRAQLISDIYNRYHSSGKW